ncbi:MAG: thioredoxin family protein [Deltaproteobacteria bacterium]|nr:thioredoxin family protein [Deltaproteobacteria bacterium]
MTRAFGSLLGLALVAACKATPQPADPKLADDVAFQDVGTAAPTAVTTSAPPTSTRATLRWESNLAQARARARQQGRRMGVWFFASWSADARRIEREWLTKPEVAELLAPLLLVKVDVSASSDANDAVLGEFGVDSVPALLVMDGGGHVLSRLGADVDLGRLRKALRDADRQH